MFNNALINPLIIAAVAFLTIIQSADDVAWGQTNPIKNAYCLDACARITLPDPSAPSGFMEVNVVTVIFCDYYDIMYYRNPGSTWNDKFTEYKYLPYYPDGFPLMNMDTSGLAYPLISYDPFNPIYNGILVSAADGNKFWDSYYAARGFTRIAVAGVPGSGDPILTMNCHGYSTGVGYWLDAFLDLMYYDYTNYYYESDLADNVVYYDGLDHSGKIDEVTSTTVGGIQRYTIVKISEKCRESAIYEKNLNLILNSGNYVQIENSYAGFYKKN